MSAFFLTSNYLSSQAVSNQVLSTYKGLTTVFGMGTGGAPQLSSLDYRDKHINMFSQNCTEERLHLGLMLLARSAN